MKDLIVLKVGGSVITDKKSEKPKPNLANIRRIAKEISESYSSGKFGLVLIHGAGSYGHQIVKRTGIDKGITNEEQKIAFAETQRLQNDLNSIVTKELIKNDIPAIPCQPSAHAIMRSGRLVKFDLEATRGFLNSGLVPVLYGVPAFDTEQRCSILSGDQIAPYVATELHARKIIHGTNVDGIFTSDPNKDKNARLIPVIKEENFSQVTDWLSGSSTVDVTGGMLGKVSELLEVARAGVESQIVNALKAGNVKKALLGERIGTTIEV